MRAFVLPALLAVIPCAFIPALGAPPLETIVVSAARTSLSVDNAGSSITVIDGDDLARRQTMALSEILRDVPGFAVSRGGVLGSATQVRVRGGEGNHVLVMIDGIEANDLGQGDEFNFAHLMSADIERIEIIRGPQSALWGSDALSGVVNVITRRGAGPWRVDGRVEGGSFGTVNGGASLSGGASAWNFHLGAAALDSEGANISRTGGEEDGYRNVSLAATGGVHLAPWLRLDATFRHVDARNEYDETDFATGLPADSDYHSDVRQDFGQVQLAADPMAGRWTTRGYLAIARTDNENYRAGQDDGSNEGQRWTVGLQSDLRWNTTLLDAAHVGTIAIEHEREAFEQRGPASFFGDPNQDRDARTTSLVAEYRLSADRGVDVGVAVRHDANNAFRNDTTWRVHGAWKVPVPGTRLRASYGTGSKNPTFTERYGFFTASIPAFAGNPHLKPERSRGWEAGIHQTWRDGRISADVAYFSERLEDEINGFVFDFSRNVITADNVAGRSHRDGVEFSARIMFAPGWLLSGHYTWLDATQPGAGGRQEQELRRPRHTGGMNLGVDLDGGRGHLDVNWTHTGSQRDLFFPPAPPFIQPVRLGSFDLLSVAASWQWTRHVGLLVRVENALDDVHEEIYGFRSPGIGAFVGMRVGFAGPSGQ